jgi:nicotinate-nucleotide adenylyltransferase
MKVALYFGSFNPVHVGHLIIAQALLNTAQVDRVWLVVSPQNPFKDKKNLLPQADRLLLCELATEGHPQIQASNVEFMLPQPSYTIDTLTHLAARYPSYAFSLLMGEDNLRSLHRWKNHRAIVDHYPIYLYPRRAKEGDEAAAPEVAEHPNVHRIAAPLLDISATEIRQMVKDKRSVRYVVTDAVRRYVEDKYLYHD